ncbi:hypothetical protein SBRCBS47491_001394 [Sporothrix bragantina]|uniref:BTB domain-containing protein n=1 Tax=Sporothrix bragantina TaxID=671064 RepID=A0ABP0AYD0_9PEZI
MPPTANKPPPSQSAGRPKNARPSVVPVIPLPLVQKQQQQRQQKQQQLELEKKQQEEKEQKEREQKAKEEQEEQEEQGKKDKELKEQQEKEAKEAAKTQQKKASQAAAKKAKDAPAGDNSHKSAEAPAAAPTPADNASSLSSTTTPQTAHETTTSVSSPVAKTPQSSTNTLPADPTAAPFVPPTASVDGHAPARVGQPQHHIPAGPSSAGPPPNGHAVPEFVFPPHSRSGSAARHRGPPRHNVNPQLPQHPLHNQHHPHPGFHQAHPSASSITFGNFHDSNNASPGPTGHGPLPPPPGLMGGGPQFIPYNVPNMGGPGEWQQGPSGAPHVGEVNINGFAPPSAGFNPSTPNSFHGSHSPDNAADGAGFQHQGGPYPVPGGPNGHLPLRNNDSMSSMMSPPFFPPTGFPNAGPHDRHGGRNGIPARGIDFQFVHHLQHHVQHSFDNPQTTDCHLVLHLPHTNSATNPESNMPDQQSVSTTMFAGHRSVLAQSYNIGNLLRSDTGIMHNGPFNQPILALHMKIEDPYISVEAAMQALRSLYGHPLADPTTDRSLSPSEALDKALANLAAGFIFMLDHVESVAADQVERLLGWDTVEKVLAFCLNGATFPNTADIEKTAYGPAFAPARLRYARGAGTAVRRLLSRAVAFLAHNIPADFVFNASTPSSTAALSTLLRFPVDTWSAVANVNASKDIGNSSTAHARSAGSVSLPMRKTSDSFSAKQGGVRSPKILFGDFAPRGDDSAKPSHSINGIVKSTTGDSQADDTNADISAVLSRILLNLPSGFLKHILDQPQLAAHRASFASAIVDERERRRLQALDGLHTGAILSEPEQRDAVLGRNQQPTPPSQSNPPFPIEEWDVLGWKEIYDGNSDHLERVWAYADASR